jgi:hypothetical protein
VKSVLNYANVGATSLFTTVEDLAAWVRNFEDGTWEANPSSNKSTKGSCSTAEIRWDTLSGRVLAYTGAYDMLPTAAAMPVFVVI